MENISRIGLTSQQVLTNRAKYGENKLPEKKQTTAFEFVLEALKDKVNIILLVLMVALGVVAAFGYGSFIEPIGILSVLALVVTLFVRNSLKMQRSAKELKDRTSVRYCKVERDGVVQQINANELVPGDIVYIEAGEGIHADGVMIEGKVAVDNATINGESEPCKKVPYDSVDKIVVQRFDPVTGEVTEITKEKKPIEFNNEPSDATSEDYIDPFSLFGGTTIVDGEGKMLVTKVGAKTVNGKTILDADEIKPPKTSLEMQIDDLVDIISKFGTISAIFIAVASLASMLLTMGGLGAFLQLPVMILFKRILEIGISAITIVVAAVPEGLPLIINLITSQNSKRMLKHNILAKNPSKIPEAGNIQLICSDKTGTLTKGKLEPVHNITLDGAEIQSGSVMENFIKNICLNSSSMFDSEGKVVGGNATERALLSMVNKAIYDGATAVKVTDRKSFNSANKYSAAETVDASGTVCTFYKGAPEKLLAVAKSCLNSNGDIVALDHAEAKRTIAGFTTRAMRVIATGYSMSPLGDTLPDDLIITSFVAIRDDVRAEVPEAVRKMHGAGVQVMMVTGDVLETAVAIAHDAGLITSGSDIAMSAIEFDALSDDEAKAKLRDIKVIARATPQTKLRIVKLAQEMGLCVGMTGDGTNDAPALKAADVGFSMGSGTDVCKEAGDIIITDDNFVSITDAVLLGRTFMHNVLKFLKFQLPINFSLVALSAAFILLCGVEAIAPIQILIINIIMDSLNSLSFGGEPPKAEYMKEQPIPKGAKLLSRDTVVQVVVSTLTFLTVFGITAIPAIRNQFGSEEGYATARFAMLVFMATLNGFNIRTDSVDLFKGIKNNPLFWQIALSIFAGTVLLCQFGGEMLHCVPLSLTQWGIIVVLSMLVLPVDIIRKKFKNGGIE